MQTLRKISKNQPHFPWLVGSAFVSLFMLIAIVSVAMGEAPQISIPVLHPSDWMLAIGMGIAIPATMLTYWAMQFLPQPLEKSQAHPEQSEQRVIVVRQPGASPEIVNRLRSELTVALAQRDEAQREYQALLQARQSAIEPERELSYQAVAALLKAGNVGIKEAIRIVRDNGGMVGRKGYDELKDLLPLLSPAAAVSPVSSDSQAVNCKPERVSRPVNRLAMSRSQPRKGRGQ